MADLKSCQDISARAYREEALVNIKDLAKHIDISVGTISRALNNKPGVDPVTREKVLAGALELGYVPNQSGRALRKGTTQTVGMVIEIGDSLRNMGDNFFMAVVDSAQATLNAAGFDLVILPCHSADDPAEFLQRVIGRGTVDAIILTATRKQDARIELLLKSRTPFVTLGRSGVPGTYSWIDLDFEGYVQSAIRELVALGHRRIAITLPDTDANLGYILMDAYKASLAEHGLVFDPALALKVEQNEYGGNLIARDILAMESRPTAVVLSYELMAIGLYSSLIEKGLKPGIDLSIIGFRQNPQLRFLQPNLSAHKIVLTDLGKELGDAVVRVIKSKSDPLRKIWPCQFEATESIGPAPTSNLEEISGQAFA